MSAIKETLRKEYKRRLEMLGDALLDQLNQLKKARDSKDSAEQEKISLQLTILNSSLLLYDTNPKLFEDRETDLQKLAIKRKRVIASTEDLIRRMNAVPQDIKQKNRLFGPLLFALESSVELLRSIDQREMKREGV